MSTTAILDEYTTVMNSLSRTFIKVFIHSRFNDKPILWCWVVKVNLENKETWEIQVYIQLYMKEKHNIIKISYDNNAKFGFSFIHLV
jgi:hypothetical protein